MKDDDGNTIIRPSSLSGYGDCARRAAATIIKDEILDAGYEVADYQSSIAASVGTAVHRGVELLLTDKMVGQYGAGTLTTATDAAVARLRHEVESGAVFDSTSPNSNTAEKQVARMTAVYARHSVDDVDPIALEERLKVDLGDGFVLSGQSDVIARSPGAVEDTKTGIVSRTHAAQLGAYTTIQRAHGRDIKLARTRFIQRVAISKDQPVPVVQNYQLWDIEPITYNRIRRIKSDVTEFRRLVDVGNADPIIAFDTNPMSMICTERFCPLWRTNGCIEWKFKEKKHE